MSGKLDAILLAIPRRKLRKTDNFHLEFISNFSSCQYFIEEFESQREPRSIFRTDKQIVNNCRGNFMKDGNLRRLMSHTNARRYPASYPLPSTYLFVKGGGRTSKRKLKFLSGEMNSYLQIYGIYTVRITILHPRTDRIEREEKLVFLHELRRVARERRAENLRALLLYIVFFFFFPLVS